MRYIPYLCPVCQGRGLVPHNFYLGSTSATSTGPELCRTCSGSGLVWGTDISNTPSPIAPFDGPYDEFQPFWCSVDKNDSPLMCLHANENPGECPCSPKCYCKSHSCKDK